jgi:DNA-binding transcriptional MerR regulator
MNAPVLRSREVAEIAGTTPRALRHYHSIGLLPEVPRDSNGYRRYSARDLVRVLRIRQLAASGMPLRRIRTMLDQDVRSQGELLEELDRELATQADRIAAQRAMLADMRTLSVRNLRAGPEQSPTVTEQFDEDVWTLVTVTGAMDADHAAPILEILQDGELGDQVRAVATEFQELEGRTHVDESTADRLAGQMLRLGHSVLAAAGVDPADDEQPVAALVQEMQANALSPAQQRVWSRFMAAMDG